MKKFMPIIYVIAFVIGIIFIITADTGVITSYYPALIAGIIISCFAGVFLAIYLYAWHKQSKWVMSIQSCGGGFYVVLVVYVNMWYDNFNCYGYWWKNDAKTLPKAHKGYVWI